MNAKSTPPKRRFWRWRLLWLFIPGALAAIPIHLFWQRLSERFDLAIVKQGGAFAGTAYRGPAFLAGYCSDWDIFQRVTVIGRPEFSFLSLPDARLRALQRLRHLERLDLSGAQFYRDDSDPIHECFADEHVRHLQAFPNLREVRVERSNLSDAGLAEFARFPQLKLLVVGAGHRLTDAGVQRVRTIRPDLDVVRWRFEKGERVMIP